ncbi:hypothetical protein H4W34_003097 [Actinomadura algeriensis]|uniref:Uncharacterized protein n=1 Tax=Actinomadura algeriensis TaxID=1679523 RepID=A0ABR9JS68_9ACTN|nr:hypothetical protein [Actinomadura algeriensis]
MAAIVVVAAGWATESMLVCRAALPTVRFP